MFLRLGVIKNRRTDNSPHSAEILYEDIPIRLDKVRQMKELLNSPKGGVFIWLRVSNFS